MTDLLIDQPYSYEADVAHIMSFYKDAVSPQTDDEEFIEIDGNTAMVKHYVYNGQCWLYHGEIERTGLQTADESNAKKRQTIVSPGAMTVVACQNPRRGMKRIAQALYTLAKMVSSGKTDKALAKIQNIMISLDGTIKKADVCKKEPTAYIKFMSEAMLRLKTEEPNMSSQERMKRSVQLWNEKKLNSTQSTSA